MRSLGASNPFLIAALSPVDSLGFSYRNPKPNESCHSTSNGRSLVRLRKKLGTVEGFLYSYRIRSLAIEENGDFRPEVWRLDSDRSPASTHSGNAH
jgi:hypothetical protein